MPDTATLLNEIKASLDAIKTSVSAIESSDAIATAVSEIRADIVKRLKDLATSREKHAFMTGLLTSAKKSYNLVTFSVDNIASNSGMMTEVVIESIDNGNNQVLVNRSDGACYRYGNTAKTEFPSIIGELFISSEPSTNSTSSVAINKKRMVSADSRTLIDVMDVAFSNPVVLYGNQSIDSIPVLIADANSGTTRDNILIGSFTVAGFNQIAYVLHSEPITGVAEGITGLGKGIWVSTRSNATQANVLNYWIYDTVLTEYRIKTSIALPSVPINIVPFNFNDGVYCLIERDQGPVLLYAINSKGVLVKVILPESFNDVKTVCNFNGEFYAIRVSNGNPVKLTKGVTEPFISGFSSEYKIDTVYDGVALNPDWLRLYANSRGETMIMAGSVDKDALIHINATASNDRHLIEGIISQKPEIYRLDDVSYMTYVHNGEVRIASINNDRDVSDIFAATFEDIRSIKVISINGYPYMLVGCAGSVTLYEINTIFGSFGWVKRV